MTERDKPPLPTPFCREALLYLRSADRADLEAALKILVDFFGVLSKSYACPSAQVTTVVRDYGRQVVYASLMILVDLLAIFVAAHSK